MLLLLVTYVKMSFVVKIKNSASKSALKIPKAERKKFFTLCQELASSGPIRKNWPNFSALGKNEYHCHLSYSWVACWRYADQSILIEVYYVGSRENAPY